MITLFTRSYHKDFEWLSYSVKSMKKNLTGIDKRVLVVPFGQVPSQDILDFYDDVHYIKELHSDGYIAQQLDKVRAFEFTDSEYILFSDSDCIYYEPFNVLADRFINNRILLPITPYAELSGDVLVWKQITGKIFGYDPVIEYMRCFPILHHRSVCQATLQPVFQYARKLQDRSLSEFNCLGFIAATHFPHLYQFELANFRIKTARQYWSWGGINETIQLELEAL